MKKEEKRKAAEDRRREIKRRYDAKMLKTKTISDCEEILRELVRDQEIPSSIYWQVYWDLEARARAIKKRQSAILQEAEAAIETTKKMLAHSGQ